MDHGISQRVGYEDTDIREICHPVTVFCGRGPRSGWIPSLGQKIAGAVDPKDAAATVGPFGDMAFAISSNDGPAQDADQIDGFALVRTVGYNIACTDCRTILSSLGQGSKRVDI